MISQAQFGNTSQISGASPIQPKYDGPAPISTPSEQGVSQPNAGIHIAKPGFF